jgi:hypothetical protein
VKSALRVLVTGSRSIPPVAHQWMCTRLSTLLDEAIVTDRTLVVVQGACPSGADFGAFTWATDMKRNGLPVVAESHPAKGHPTENFGEWPDAGPRRNSFMVGLGADRCVAVICQCTSTYCRRNDRHPSHGTMDCVRKAKAAEIPLDKLELWKES